MKTTTATTTKAKYKMPEPQEEYDAFMDEITNCFQETIKNHQRNQGRT